MYTITIIVTIFRIKVISRYLAISGMVSDVGGNIFETSNRNTTKANNMEMVSVIYIASSFNDTERFPFVL